VDKIVDQYTVLVKEMFKKDVNINKFIGKEIIMEANSLVGKIHSSFGNSGKIKVTFSEPILKESLTEENIVGSRVAMNYKKYYSAIPKKE
jgi:selenocysteine-specific elongation factor